MKFYKAAERIRVTGEIGLTDEQAKRRGKRVEKGKGAGVYVAHDAIDIKAGELVGFDEVPKVHLRSLVGGEGGNEPIEFDPKSGTPKAGKPKGDEGAK